MKHQFLCLFFLLVTSALTAQEDFTLADTSRGGVRYVISPAGLNLRAQPNRRSKILQLLPFGEKVNVISPQYFGHDTIYIEQWDDEQKQPYQEAIDGVWLRVRHGQIQGYMFSAYLDWKKAKIFEGDEALNQDFVLLLPYKGCFNNFFYPSGWHWYGVYEESGKTALKKVKASFYVESSGMAPYGITANDTKGLRFIIGSKMPLLEGALRGQAYGFESNLFDYNQVLNDTLLQKNNLSILHGNKHDFWKTLQLVVHQGAQQQILTSEITLGEGLWSLYWRGDLDGDQKDDYIFRFGEKSSRTILFLSKPATKGKLVKPVAVYYSGYCC